MPRHPGRRQPAQGLAAPRTLWGRGLRFARPAGSPPSRTIRERAPSKILASLLPNITWRSEGRLSAGMVIGRLGYGRSYLSPTSTVGAPFGSFTTRTLNRTSRSRSTAAIFPVYA